MFNECSLILEFVYSLFRKSWTTTKRILPAVTLCIQFRFIGLICEALKQGSNNVLPLKYSYTDTLNTMQQHQAL